MSARPRHPSSDVPRQSPYEVCEYQKRERWLVFFVTTMNMCSLKMCFDFDRHDRLINRRSQSRRSDHLAVKMLHTDLHFSHCVCENAVKTRKARIRSDDSPYVRNESPGVRCITVYMQNNFASSRSFTDVDHERSLSQVRISRVFESSWAYLQSCSICYSRTWLSVIDCRISRDIL